MNIPPKQAFTVNVRSCARCTQFHPQLKFEPFTRAPDQFEFFAMCPILHEPILMTAGADELFRDAVAESQK